MELMSKQKGKKLKSKYKSVLMNQFNKDITKKAKLRGPRRRVQTVVESSKREVQPEARRQLRKDLSKKSQLSRRESQALDKKSRLERLNSRDRRGSQNSGQSQKTKGSTKANKTSIGESSESKTIFSKEAQMHQQRRSSKKTMPHIGNIQMTSNYREFQEEQKRKGQKEARELKSEQKIDKPRPPRAGLERISGRKRKSREVKKSARKYVMRSQKGPNIWEKNFEPRRKKDKSNSIVGKEPRVSISTKAITDMNIGGDAMDEVEVLKFMMLKKNKIKKIRQQSLMTLAELKKKAPPEKCLDQFDDIKVENIVIKDHSAMEANFLDASNYKNPRNSLAIRKKKNFTLDKGEVELDSKTEQVEPERCILDELKRSCNDDFQNKDSGILERVDTFGVKNPKPVKVEKVEKKEESFQAEEPKRKSETVKSSQNENSMRESETKVEVFFKESKEEIKPNLESKIDLKKDVTSLSIEESEEDKIISQDEQKKSEIAEESKSIVEVEEKEKTISSNFSHKIKKDNSKSLEKEDVDIEDKENNRSKESETKETETFSGEIKLENFEEMSEADIIKNGQQIILKNLNNKEFIKKILKEVTKIKNKESIEIMESDTQPDAPASSNSQKSETAQDVTKSRKESSEKALSIITLDSEQEEFIEDDEGEKMIEEIFPEKEEQGIPRKEESAALTDFDQDSLFRWNSNYNEELSSLKNTVELQKKKDQECEENIEQLKVTKYNETLGRNRVINPETLARKGTFRKSKFSQSEAIEKNESVSSENEGKSLQI